MADLEITTTHRVMIAKLNRPDKKNALSEEMLNSLKAPWTWPTMTLALVAL